MAELTVPKEKIEGEGVKVVNHSLRLSTIAMLRAHSKSSRVNMSRIVDDAVREFIERADPAATRQLEGEKRG